MEPRHECRGNFEDVSVFNLRLVLQWSRGTSAAEIGLVGNTPEHDDALASMEPRHECRGNQVVIHTNLSGETPLQWSRGKSAAEIRSESTVVSYSDPSASMEPRHECRGNAPAARDSAPYSIASMEPRHECRGNGGLTRMAADTHIPLQWSRGTSAAEISFNPSAPLSRVARLQWSRGTSAAEIGAPR